MNGNGLSAGDILALTKENGSNFLEGNGILIILFFLVFFGGFGNFGGMNTGTVTSGFENQNVINKLDTLGTGLGNATWNLNTEIKNAEAALQKCCCETQKEIIENRYSAERNTAALVNAVHADGEATRKLINDSVTQRLRDELDQARDVISNVNQSRYILDQLGTYRTNPPCYPNYSPCCGGACGNLYA